MARVTGNYARRFSCTSPDCRHSVAVAVAVVPTCSSSTRVLLRKCPSQFMGPYMSSHTDVRLMVPCRVGSGTLPVENTSVLLKRAVRPERHG